MGGDSGVECCGDCAVEHGRRQQGLTSTKEYRVEGRGGGKKRFALRQDAEVGSTPKRAKGSSSRESFHAAVSSGGERSWISAAVSLSMTTIGPPHLGQRQRSCESLVEERS